MRRKFPAIVTKRKSGITAAASGGRLVVSVNDGQVILESQSLATLTTGKSGRYAEAPGLGWVARDTTTSTRNDSGIVTIPGWLNGTM